MASIIDPRLQGIPAQGVIYDESEEAAGDQYPEIVEVISTDDVEVELLFEDPEIAAEDALEPPSSITVVSQTVRIGTAGTQTVDIVVEIADVPGASEYERRDSV